MEFSEEDVKLLGEMATNFYRLRGTNKVLDEFDIEGVAYLPVFALALLWSQKRIERLTSVLIWLTIVLGILAGVSVWAAVH